MVRDHPTINREAMDNVLLLPVGGVLVEEGRVGVTLPSLITGSGF